MDLMIRAKYIVKNYVFIKILLKKFNIIFIFYVNRFWRLVVRFEIIITTHLTSQLILIIKKKNFALKPIWN